MSSPSESLKQQYATEVVKLDADEKLLRRLERGIRFLQEVAGPAGTLGPSVSSEPAIADMIANLKGLPSAKVFGTEFHMFQNNKIQLMSCYRPSTAKGPPGALIHETFGEFLENCQHIPLDPWICQQVTNFNVMMSASYRTPVPKSKMSKKSRMLLRHLELQSQKILIDPVHSKVSQLPSASTSEDYIQPASGGLEAERMTRVRRFLSDLLGHYAATDVKPSLDISPPTQDAEGINDGSYSVMDNSLNKLTIVMLLEGKEGWETGGQSDPAMELIRNFSMMLQNRADQKHFKLSNMPCFGLVVVGDMLKVYALFVTDRVCAEPLTNAVHFNNLLHANFEQVRATARLLKSLALGTNKLYSEMQLLRERQDPLQRSDMLTRGVPYPLHDTLRYVQVTKRDTSGCKEIYDVTVLPLQQSAVVKFTQHLYPQQVHVECANRHLAPELLGVYPMPGGFTQVVMQLLTDPWTNLERATQAQFADPKLEEAVKVAVHELHAISDYRPGDIRRPNVMFRPESDGSYSVRFLDLDWCGPETQAKYPDFMSRYIDWPDDALEGTPILEKHDLEMAELMFRPNDKSVQDQRRRKRQAPLSMAFNSAVRMHHRGFLAKLCGSRLLQARQGCCRF